jgi:hypothetical protein
VPFDKLRAHTRATLHFDKLRAHTRATLHFDKLRAHTRATLHFDKLRAQDHFKPESGPRSCQGSQLKITSQ